MIYHCGPVCGEKGFTFVSAGRPRPIAKSFRAKSSTIRVRGIIGKAEWPGTLEALGNTRRLPARPGGLFGVLPEQW